MPASPRSSLRIGVDLRGAAEAERRGIGHYVVQVATEMLRRYGGEHEWRGLCLGANPSCIPAEITKAMPVAHRRVGKLAAHYLTSRATHHWDDRYLGSLDVFFVPSAHLLALDPSLPVVVTVHDAFWARARRYMSSRERLWHHLVAPERLYSRAQRLLANSETTAAQVSALLPSLSDRIAIVPHGIDVAFRASPSVSVLTETLARVGIDSPYILYLGGIEPRKNIRRLVQAFQVARYEGLDEVLVLAGRLSADSAGELRGLSLDNVRVLGYVAEEDKPALYAGATAFAFPAHDEGLGLPPLEALACGTPSVVSDIEIFRETLGPAAVRVNPEDTEAIADGLVRLCKQEHLRAKLVRLGRPRLARYDWARCAETTYQEIFEIGSRGS